MRLAPPPLPLMSAFTTPRGLAPFRGRSGLRSRSNAACLSCGRHLRRRHGVAGCAHGELRDRGALAVETRNCRPAGMRRGRDARPQLSVSSKFRTRRGGPAREDARGAEMSAEEADMFRNMNRRLEMRGQDEAGRRRRFDAMYAEHHARVLGYVLRRTDSPDDAADVLAETFLVAWRRLDDMPSEEVSHLWLYGVARRILANHRRGERRRTKLADRVRDELAARLPLPAPSGDGTPFAAAFRSLSNDDREVLALHGWEGSTPGRSQACWASRATPRGSGCTVPACGYEPHLPTHMPSRPRSLRASIGRHRLGRRSHRPGSNRIQRSDCQLTSLTGS